MPYMLPGCLFHLRLHHSIYISLHFYCIYTCTHPVIVPTIILLFLFFPTKTCIFAQEPTTIKVGEPYHISQFTGAKRRLVEVYDSYQYVPLLESLRILLSDPTVIEQIEQCQNRIRTDGTLQDFCDGELFKQHPLFSRDSMALQIIAYYDELIL